MSIESPDFLYLLIFVPFGALLFWLIVRQAERVKKQFNLGRMARLGRPSNRFRYYRLTLLFIVAATSLIIAVADVKIEDSREEPIYKRINPIFILDTSLSMRARDIVPSRLGRAGQEITNFILHRDENIGQMGLVTFSGSSLILSYLTSDPQNILFYLEYLQTDLPAAFGTDIGGAIKSALALLSQERELNESLQPEDTIFILISDGEDHGETLREAVQECVELGIRVYCLGLGSQMGGYIPLGERDGRTVYLINEDGERVLSTFDEASLRWVAGASGGSYNRSHTGAELYQSLNEILWSERQVIGTETVTEETSLHYWFLAAAFAGLALFLMN